MRLESRQPATQMRYGPTNKKFSDHRLILFILFIKIEKKNINVLLMVCLQTIVNILKMPEYFKHA